MNRRDFVFCAKLVRQRVFVIQNVDSVFHLGRTGENYFYAMEFVERETLENLMKRSGPVFYARAARVFPVTELRAPDSVHRLIEEPGR